MAKPGLVEELRQFQKALQGFARSYVVKTGRELQGKVKSLLAARALSDDKASGHRKLLASVISETADKKATIARRAFCKRRPVLAEKWARIEALAKAGGFAIREEVRREVSDALLPLTPEMDSAAATLGRLRKIERLLLVTVPILLGEAAAERQNPLGLPQEKRDEKGFVEAPSDPDAYRAANKILADFPVQAPTYKDLTRILEAHPEIRRWKPSKHRLSVHLGDWQKYVESRTASDPDGFLRDETEIAKRKAQVDARRARRKRK